MDSVSRSHEADDGVWVDHEKALDRTMSAMCKILVCRKALLNNDGQSNRDDVANAVFPLKVDTPAVPLPPSTVQTFNPVPKNMPEVFKIFPLEKCRGQSVSAGTSWMKQA